jgi:undecaprenyl-diphosphatase
LNGEVSIRRVANRARAPASLLAVVVALALLAYLASSNDRFPGDLEVSKWVQSLRADWLDLAMETVSFAGVEYVAGAIVALSVLALLVAGRRSGAAMVVTAMAVGFGLRTVLKQVVARPRPSEGLVQVIEDADGYAFPSGHVMFYVVLLGALWLVLTASDASNRARWAVSAAIAVALLLIGYSRVYLGVHWVSDVAGGYIFGAVVVAVAAWAWQQWATAPGAAGVRSGGG